ncbi:MAG: hypothetical protein MZV64_33005 [Ignavibacteriales bacterium]|nr:hypothetical protein [Ignavibacteriales bacterium]
MDIDLSFLSGQKVKFILTILANGSSHEDYGLWVNPSITRQSAQPPTATPTPTLSPTVTAHRQRPRPLPPPRPPHRQPPVTPSYP